MKVLIDECIPRKFKKSIVGHECQTVPEAGLAGKKNGELLTAAERAGFDVLLTVDRSILHQQNLSKRNVALLVIHAQSNDIEDLLPYVAACLLALRTIKRGQIVRVG